MLTVTPWTKQQIHLTGAGRRLSQWPIEQGWRQGLGDPLARGRLTTARVGAPLVVRPLRGAMGPPQATSDLGAALKATLADPEGKLNQAHRPSASNTHPVFWAAKAPHRETTITPHA